MNMSTESTKRAETSLTRDWINFAGHYIRPYLGGRRGMLIMAVVLVVIAGALNWNWLVAVGLAPLLIAVAPCAVMCALGLCMSRMGGRSCSRQSPAAREDADASSSQPAVKSDNPAALLQAADRGADAAADQRLGDDENQTPSINSKRSD